MKAKPVVHKNGGCAYPYWRLAVCGSLAGPYLRRVIVNQWAKVTCKRCLRMAPKAVKARLGLA
jgi:hypothetical protein